jgi:hypothetical protein
MKRFLLIGVAAIVGFGVAWVSVSKYHSARAETALREKEKAWQQERDLLLSQLKEAQARLANTTKVSPRTEVVEVTKKQSPAEIIALLKTLRIQSKDTKNIRLAIQQLENLIELGESALPEIQTFLATQTDIDYDPSIFGSWKGSKDGHVPIDFVFPPSLRFGLFDATRKIGGAQAEKLLTDTLGITGRGVELAYLTRVLQELAPFKYRELAISSAKELLNNPLNSNAGNGLDRYERNYLFGVLAFYKDSSLAQQAQNGLVQADGKIDRGALQYLKETLGSQTVPVVAQLYQDARISDGQQKEPLARLALNFAGADEQADTLYQFAIKDPNLTPDSRRELIEDLNQDGYDNLKNFSEHDVQLIRNRLALIEKSRDSADPKIITDAFDEAEKDLRNMLAKATQRP